MAADRMNEQVSYLYNHITRNPSLINNVIKAAHASEGKWAEVCVVVMMTNCCSTSIVWNGAWIKFNVSDICSSYT